MSTPPPPRGGCSTRLIVMDSKIEQCVVIKFLIDSGEKPAKIFLKLKNVFCNECASRSLVFEWARRFE